MSHRLVSSLLTTPQGVDLDWEVPLNEADKNGYTALAKELRASFGTTYKISLAFPVDYGDMFYVDAKGMEPHLDWIGYMAYDLKNADGSVAAHTDIVKLQNNALPFWFSGIPPAKLNLGLASYGRGYTLASTLALPRLFSLSSSNPRIPRAPLKSICNVYVDWW